MIYFKDYINFIYYITYKAFNYINFEFMFITYKIIEDKRIKKFKIKILICGNNI